MTCNLDILTVADMQTLGQIIGDSRNVLICTHRAPDGDAIGSSLAWAQYLKKLDKDVNIAVPDMYPDFLQWLPGCNRIFRFDKKPEEVAQLFKNADLLCCLDFNSSSRTDDMKYLIDSFNGRILLIDHHLSPDIPATLTISQPSMSSTCELVFRIINQLEGYEDMTKEMATAIYCGMMTDTGSFAYNSNSPDIYFIISMLLAKGIDKDLIYNKVYHTLSASCLKMRAYVLYRKMNIVNELNASYFALTKQEMKRFRYIKGDLEGLVNEPLRIKNMKLSISLREDTEKPNHILVSLRSSCGFHCEPMAREFFNGGGHMDAAGGKLYCSISDAEQIAIRAILAYKDQLR